MMTEERTVRPSPIAGTWYPGNAIQLRNSVSAFLDAAVNPTLPGQVVGLVAPHAGYVYSGTVSGHAFKTVQGLSFEYVCLLAPMHQYYPQSLLTSAHRAYWTPLGEIPLPMRLSIKSTPGCARKLGSG